VWSVSGAESHYLVIKLAMAEQGTNHRDAPRINCALPLVDFDWKLKYAVASSSIAAVNKPLLRLELYVSKSPIKPGATVLSEDQIQPFVAEYSKSQLDTLLREMDAIEQGLAGGAGNAM
jgi:hypothetical protein